ncbi:MAG: two-component regulator propeller domain-containing protein [Acidobacteriota bacterium]
MLAAAMLGNSFITIQDHLLSRRFTDLACVVLFFSLPLAAMAERLPVKTYTVADGLLQDRVTKIKQDSRGFLWLCSAEGVSRFDGYEFTNFTTRDGLPASRVNDVLETKNGVIYVATDGGLARLNPTGLAESKDNPLFTIFLPDGQPVNILTLYQDKKDQIWAGTTGGLYKVTETDGIVFEPVPLGEPLKTGKAETGPNSLAVKAILEDHYGTLWIGTFGSGLFRLSQDGSVRRYIAYDDGFGDNKITDLLEARDGRLWMSMRSDQEGGVCLLDEADEEKPVRKCYTTKDGLGSNWVREMVETSDGQLWLATVPGLCQWQGEGSASVCKTYTAKNDLCDDVLALAEDKDGNLWSGSQCGAKKIVRYGFTTYTSADGLDSNQINSIFEDSVGQFFATTYAKKLFDNTYPKSGLFIARFRDGRFSLVKLRLPNYVDYFGFAWQQTIRQDRAGAWWIPTGVGLFRSPDRTSFEDLSHATLEKIETGAKGLEVFRLFEDSRDDIWILTTGDAHELLRWERSKNIWHDYTEQVGLSGYRFGSALIEDSQGNVWIGTDSNFGDSALVRYRNGEFRVLTPADGSPSDGVLDLFVDSHQRLWIASANQGLWRLNEPNSDKFEFVKYTPSSGLTSISTATVTEDEFGRIYVGTRRGIDRLNPDTGQIESFTTADGLPTGFVEVSYRDRKNTLWFGTHEGLSRFVPEPPRTRNPPNVLIMGLRVNGESQSVSVLGESTIPKLKLNSDQKQVSVDFLGLGASPGEKLKYEYRLGTSEWSETAERTINFASIASGDSQIEIRSITADRLYSRPALISLHIDAPLWQRPWFIAALVAMMVFMIYLLYRFRLSRVLEVVNIRMRIATDLHDDIGANLTKITILSEVAQQRLEHDADGKTNGKENLLGSVAEISRESVASMGDIVWAIDPKKDSLIGLTRRMRRYAEEILERRDIHLEFNAPVVEPDLKLGADLRRDLYLIFKEAVNNIVRHSKAAKVTIDFRLVGKELVLQISDDGIGFKTDGEYDGNGLSNINKRATDRGGELEIDSTSGVGTRIILRVKVRSAWSWK